MVAYASLAPSGDHQWATCDWKISSARDKGSFQAGAFPGLRRSGAACWNTALSKAPGRKGGKAVRIFDDVAPKLFPLRRADVIFTFVQPVAEPVEDAALFAGGHQANGPALHRGAVVDVVFENKDLRREGDREESRSLLPPISVRAVRSPPCPAPAGPSKMLRRGRPPLLRCASAPPYGKALFSYR